MILLEWEGETRPGWLLSSSCACCSTPDLLCSGFCTALYTGERINRVYAVFKMGSCCFHLSSKMYRGGRAPSAELCPCAGEQQNWSRRDRCRRSSVDFEQNSGFLSTEELMAVTDSESCVNHPRSGSSHIASLYMCLFFCPF